MNETLVRVVAETIAFLELSGDDAIDPDVAVAQMESVAFQLEHLSGDERDELFAFVDGTLLPEALALGRQELADLYRGLRSSLGL